jgi:hypothetical protein
MLNLRGAFVVAIVLSTSGNYSSSAKGQKRGLLLRVGAELGRVKIPISPFYPVSFEPLIQTMMKAICGINAGMSSREVGPQSDGCKQQ